LTTSLYREETPIEEYLVKGTRVFVKREDLYARPPAPPLGKLRGMRVVLKDMFEKQVRLVGCWDTRVSRLGHGLAAACREFPGMRPIVSYPTKKGAGIPPSIDSAQALGAEVLPLRGNHVGICYTQARKYVEERGGRMLPFGLECSEAVREVAQEAAKTPPELANGTVLLCCGSGVTLAGLLCGLPATPRRLIGLSSGRSLAKIRACIERYVSGLPSWLVLEPARVPYDSISTTDCPFPAHPNYDLKVWELLNEDIDRFKEPIFFWNIGS